MNFSAKYGKIPTTECKGGVSMRRTKECDAPALEKMEAHKVIKAMRIYLGLSQEEIAKKAGISHLLYHRYENEEGKILRGNFSEVCMILKILHLNPRKFYHGEYVLNEAGYKAAAHRRGRVNFLLRKSVQKCCPVSCRKSDE